MLLPDEILLDITRWVVRTAHSFHIVPFDMSYYQSFMGKAPKPPQSFTGFQDTLTTGRGGTTHLMTRVSTSQH